MVREWKLRTGFKVGFTVKDKEDFDVQFFISYQKYQKYFASKFPKEIKGSEEELILSLCKGTNLTIKEVMNLKLSFIIIHELIKDKENYLNWYSSQDRK